MTKESAERREIAVEQSNDVNIEHIDSLRAETRANERDEVIRLSKECP